jgi:malate dehydrogenase (oxaloacetate-decarboxylating)
MGKDGPKQPGYALLRTPLTNKGTAFTQEERARLGIEGLLPPGVMTLDQQKERIYRRFRLQPSPLAQHIYLRDLQDRNEVLFYATLLDHLEEMLPVIYTPTIAEAVRLFSEIHRAGRGLFVSTDNIDRVAGALSNVPADEVRLAVATDSSAILGIGDQGVGGIGICIGKLSIYTAGGGLPPHQTLPIGLDVGTNREELLKDPLYLGVRHERLTGDAYYAFMDAFVEALAARYPALVLQWEDLSKDTAFTVLERYRKRLPSFNDDIQGTGAVALAGVLRACELKGERFAGQRIVISGAGAGGAGVAWALQQGLVRSGLDQEEARRRVFVLDSRGLLIEGRPMDTFKQPFAQPATEVEGWGQSGQLPSLYEVVQRSRATVLIGLSGQAASFTQPLIEAMAANVERPIIMPLSNPTSSAEAIPADVVEWTRGLALIATGSPFDDVEHQGAIHPVGQGNNAFIFPGLGLGAVLSRASEVTDNMVLAGAYALAASPWIEPGHLYPRIAKLREVSMNIAAVVMHQAVTDGVAREPAVLQKDLVQLEAFAEASAWWPAYAEYQDRLT